MRIIITENKLEKLAINLINEKFIDVEPYNAKGFPSYIFFQKDGKIIFQYEKDKERATFETDVYEGLDSYFNMDYFSVKQLLVVWMWEKYKLKTSDIRFASDATHNTWDVIEVKIRYEGFN
jgi:hypothetical protein